MNNMPKKHMKGISENMIIGIAFILIFAFLIALGIKLMSEAGVANAGIAAKFKAYYICRNSGYSGLWSCIKSIFGGG